MKNLKNTNKLIQYASSIAALFHDFGKANELFQKKLKAEEVTETYRHEWVSLRIFEAFTKGKSDHEWIQNLINCDYSGAPIVEDGIQPLANSNRNPLVCLPPLAQLVGWLILTHHKLPFADKHRGTPRINDGDDKASVWFINYMDSTWNSPLKENTKDVHQNWNFIHGLPYQSQTWMAAAKKIATAVKDDISLGSLQDPLNNLQYTTHIARMCLMLADHYYSRSGVDISHQGHYDAYANTDENRQLKQKLDEHLIGVSIFSEKIAENLIKVRETLPSLPTNLTEEKYSDKFKWQGRAEQKAKSIAKSTETHGFFGINIASTGTGKTIGNAKIIRAIGQETNGVRFNVAIGLRILTLQTAKSFQEKMFLTEKDLGCLVGGQFSHLNEPNFHNGSESSHPLSDETVIVHGDGRQHALSEWTCDEKNVDNLLVPPVLVCTIDHLISASEGIRGGKQIAPLLRLMTSDLILDEPDDFNLEDLPALCRLIYFTGLCGSRVLLSTATMPPSLAKACFDAYAYGWNAYAKENGLDNEGDIQCALFDEFLEPETFLAKELKTFSKHHVRFINRHIEEIEKQPAKHRGEIIEIICDKNNLKSISETVFYHIPKLHKNHHQEKNNKTISFGLVRMSNINSLVKISRELLNMDAPVDTQIHYCVYHSRFPGIVRAKIESYLDEILNRKSPELIWENKHVKEKITDSTCGNHIFIVIASPVAEVGRDHDYDWCIAEPSSIRSLIQVSGRVLRHREKEVEHPNVLILNQNHKTLRRKCDICFEKPGFESENLKFKSHAMSEILLRDDYDKINAKSRLMEGDLRTFSMSFKGLEHLAIKQKMTDSAHFWRPPQSGITPTWCGEFQKQQQFRKSQPQETFLLLQENGKNTILWENTHCYPTTYSENTGVANVIFEKCEMLDYGVNSSFWFDLDYFQIYQETAANLHIQIADVGKKFGEFSCNVYNSQQVFKFNEQLGFFNDTK